MPKVERALKHNRNERKNEKNPFHQYKKASQEMLHLPEEPISNSDVITANPPLKKSSVRWKLPPKVEQSEEYVEASSANSTPAVTPATALIKAFDDLDMSALKKGYVADSEDESVLEADSCESGSEQEDYASFPSGDLIAPMGADAGDVGGYKG